LRKNPSLGGGIFNIENNYVQIREKFSFCVAVLLTGLHSSLDLQVRGEPDVAFGDKHADTVQDEELHDAQGHQ